MTSSGSDVEIPIDPYAEDSDPGFGDDLASETTSLSSSITHYRYENGRRYHAYKDGEYWGPNDDRQSDQLDILYHTYTLLFDGKLHHAPIGDDPQDVLDVGTGTGIWAIDFADQYPSAKVIGTDLSPTQPSWVPPNLKFEIEDANSTWTFRLNNFDFIHVNGLFGSIRDWPAFYHQAFIHLKPGGWYEQVECSVEWSCDDKSIACDSVLDRWNKMFVKTGDKIGKTFRIFELQKNYMIEEGFKNVQEIRYKMPIGPWSSDKKLKEVGKWQLLETLQGLEGWTLALLTRVEGWTYDEVQVFLAETRAAFKNRSIHAYTRVYATFGQRPEA